MARLTAAMWPGDEVRITLRRGAEQKVLTATVGRAPALASGPEIKDQPADTTAGEKRESGR
jgi:hypothetical protein